MVPARRRGASGRLALRFGPGGLALTWALLAPAAGLAQEIPGKLVCSWVGNSFEGAGPNGKGRWVQHCMDEIEVTPEGAVITAHPWDEAGRCTGIYKDGDVNTDLLKQYNGRGNHKAWGWGTAGRAVAADSSFIYLVNTDGVLMRFRWDPSNIHFYEYVGETRACPAVGLSARGERLFLAGEKGEIQVRRTSDLSLAGSFTVPGAKDLVADAKDTLWILVGQEIRRYSLEGTRLPETISDAGSPVAVSIDHQQGRLVVCDDGPRQQVLFYDISGPPRLVGTFGQASGIRSGTPGEVRPLKFFALVGAGVDAKGNIYVAMGRNESVIRKFTPAGELVWELQAHPFVECYDFDASTDGREIYGIEEILEMDYSKPPGKEWRFKAFTRDAIRYPDDPRAKEASGWSALVRRLEGRRLLYGIGQMAHGVHILVFEDPPSQIARYCQFIGGKDSGWAWEVDSRGDIWQGEAPGRKIRRYRFKGFDKQGSPLYDTAAPDEFDWPEPFDRVQRTKYIPETDTMFITGYTPRKGEKSWGLVGSVLCRYDDWSKGNRKPKYEIDMPTDDEGLHPKSLDVAGEYVFFAMVKPTKGRPAMVHVFRASDGSRVGAMYPGPEVGGVSGWVDTVCGLRAFRRSSGEYLVLVEEDWRAKNILYRWTPPGGTGRAASGGPGR